MNSIEEFLDDQKGDEGTFVEFLRVLESGSDQWQFWVMTHTMYELRDKILEYGRLDKHLNV